MTVMMMILAGDTEEGDGMDLAEFMEFLHNAAASTNPASAKMAKEYADKRRERLENRVFTRVHNIK